MLYSILVHKLDAQGDWGALENRRDGTAYLDGFEFTIRGGKRLSLPGEFLKNMLTDVNLSGLKRRTFITELFKVISKGELDVNRVKSGIQDVINDSNIHASFEVGKP